MPVGRRLFARSAIASTILVVWAGLAGPMPSATIAGTSALATGNRVQVPPEPPDSPDDFVARGFTELLTPGAADDDQNFVVGDIAMSDDGRFVVFDTTEDFDGDDNVFADVYLVDRDTDGDGRYDESGETTMILVSSVDGVVANGPSTEPDISADGRWVVFTSEATNLLPNEDDDDDADVYLWDRLDPLAPMVLVSADVPGGPPAPEQPTVSDDGRRVAFANRCLDVPTVCAGIADEVMLWQRGATPELQTVPRLDPSAATEEHFDPAIAGNGSIVAFIAFICPGTTCTRTLGAYDVATDTVTPVPVGGHTLPEDPSVSADGELVAFAAVGTSVQLTQIYVSHRSTGDVELISSMAGAPGESTSTEPSISSDGRYVAYVTFAANLLRTGANEFAQQVVVRDRANPSAENELVSADEVVDDEASELGDSESNHPAVSSNAGPFADPAVPAGLPFVAFSSFASDISGSDDDNEHDVFVRSFLSAELLDPGPVTFGDVAVGTTRIRPVPFEANRFGFGPVAGRRAFFETAGSAFSTTALACPAVQPGQTCSVIARFAATEIGSDANQLVVEYDTNPTFLDVDEADGIFPQATASVRANGAAGGLVFEPAVVAFGDKPIGRTTPAVNVTVQLRGNPADAGSVNFTEIVVTGPGAADYTVTAADCLGPGAVGVGDPCVVTVTFKPSAIGSRPAVIEFRSGGGGPTELVELTGSGIQPTIILNPAVVHSGGVIGVQGLDWPPGEEVRLTIPAMPKALDLTVAPNGTVELPTVIFRSRTFGPREIMAEVVDTPSIRLAQPVILLVQAPGSDVVDIIGRY
jgi:Tol biopolymer transport system component